MRANPVARVIVVVGLIGVALVIGTRGADSDERTKEVKVMDVSVTSAVENFYAALNSMFSGDGQPIKDAWSHSGDITYMGPSGEYLIGWKNIEKEWDKNTAAKLGGKVRAEKINIVSTVDMAYLSCMEVGENLIDGKTETVNLRSSTIFRKEHGVWKVIGHQTDLLGFMTRPR